MGEEERKNKVLLHKSVFLDSSYLCFKYWTILPFGAVNGYSNVITSMAIRKAFEKFNITRGPNYTLLFGRVHRQKLLGITDLIFDKLIC